MEKINNNDGRATGPVVGAAQIYRDSHRYIWAPDADATRRKLLILFILFILVGVGMDKVVWAEDKSWNATGDAVDWFDDANWYPSAAPSLADDVAVDFLDASVNIPKNFQAKTLTLGGKKNVELSVDNFITGQVAPGNTAAVALSNRKGGHMTMRGSAGKVTLKGSYKSSKKPLSEEPSFTFYVQ